jgi:hypothetical protein
MDCWSEDEFFGSFFDWKLSRNSVDSTSNLIGNSIPELKEKKFCLPKFYKNKELHFQLIFRHSHP